nr:glycosyltransferase family 4 protein [Rhizomicrobium electricum]
MAKRAFWRLDPFLHWAAARTDVIFYGNANLAPPFRSCKAKVVLRPQASSVPELLADPVRPLTFKILSVGRFIPLKNFDATLDGFAAFLLRNRECGAQLTLIGSGTLEPHLRERACELGIDCNVAFVRWGKQSDLAEHYRTSAVFVFPSFESQGLVVAEAMGAGAPVICMENSGPSFLAGSTGAVVTRRDYQSTVSEIADRLEQLYQEWADDTKSFRFTSRMQRVRREYDRRLDTDALVDAIDAAYHG